MVPNSSFCFKCTNQARSLNGNCFSSSAAHLSWDAKNFFQLDIKTYTKIFIATTVNFNCYMYKNIKTEKNYDFSLKIMNKKIHLTLKFHNLE